MKFIIKSLESCVLLRVQCEMSTVSEATPLQASIEDITRPSTAILDTDTTCTVMTLDELRSTQIFPYMDLPGELRDHISEYALQDMFNGIELAIVGYQNQGKMPKRRTHPLLLASRKIYYEARDVMRRSCLLQLDRSWMVNIDLPAFISPGLITNIARIRISDRGGHSFFTPLLKRGRERRTEIFYYLLRLVRSIGGLLENGHTLKEFVVVFTGAPRHYTGVGYARLTAALPCDVIGESLMASLGNLRDIKTVKFLGANMENCCGRLPRLEDCTGRLGRLAALMTSPKTAVPVRTGSYQSGRRICSVLETPYDYGEQMARAERLISIAEYQTQRHNFILMRTFSESVLQLSFWQVIQNLRLITDRQDAIEEDPEDVSIATMPKVLYTRSHSSTWMQRR